MNRTLTVTIASGQSLSAAVALGSSVPLAVWMPAAFTGTELTFRGSDDNITFQDIYDGGVELSIAAAASQNVILPAAAMAAFTYLKLRSGTAAAPTAEGAARTLWLLSRTEF